MKDKHGYMFNLLLIISMNLFLYIDSCINFFKTKKAGRTSENPGFGILFSVLGEFAWMMIGSTILGTLSAMVCALLLKHVDLRRNASLEFGLMLLASYFPYCAAEALELRLAEIYS